MRISIFFYLLAGTFVSATIKAMKLNTMTFDHPIYPAILVIVIGLIGLHFDD